MISVKSSSLFSLLIVVSLGGVGSARAQQDNGYAPPPMFEDLTPPMVRPETNNGYIVEPKASPDTPLPPESNARPVIIPRVSTDPNVVSQPAPVTTTTTTAPVPQQPIVQPAAPSAPKMMQPIIEPKDIRAPKKPVTPIKPSAKKPDVKNPIVEKPKAPAPTPVPAPRPETKAPEASMPAPAVPATPVAPVAPEKKVEETAPVPVPAPVQRDPRESAIQGPKTMPALPTENVDEQKTFDTSTPEKETILERRQSEVAAEKAEKSESLKPPVPKANVAPATLEQGEQGALKKTIPFQQGQIGLSSAEIDPIAVAVTRELDGAERDDWRVQIKAYATPYGTGVSSDRRIALSRALSLRTALIAQGVPAARIDVLAEGQPTDGAQPGDRIDLYLYGPAKD